MMGRKRDQVFSENAILRHGTKARGLHLLNIQIPTTNHAPGLPRPGHLFHF